MINTIEQTLSWDSETTLPYGAVAHRTAQYRFLGDYKNSFWQKPEMDTLLSSSLKDESLEPHEKRNVELINREFVRRQKLPASLLSERTAQAKQTHQIWRKAKEKNQFTMVIPDMKKLFNLNREYGTKLAEAFGMNDPFDAIVSTRDPGFSVSKISSLFEDNRNFLIPLIKQVQKKQERSDYSILKTKVDRATKEKLAAEVVKFYKYDSGSDTHARIGEVEHPLTIRCGPQDARITVKFEAWEKVVFSAAHEVGHAIHSFNVKDEWKLEPIGQYGSPSLGECNSRYTENKIGRSPEFWEYFFPKLNDITGGLAKDYTSDEFLQLLNRVVPGVSRMKADEVTYALHIIIRFELEQELFSDKLTIEELPQAWNERYDKYLGITPQTDTEGLMQDLHWYNVYWGYFQGYALGDIMGTQLHHTMEKQNPEWKEAARSGDYSPVYNFFVDNVYSVGALYDPMQLVEKVTGEPLTNKYLQNYLKAKYT